MFADISLKRLLSLEMFKIQMLGLDSDLNLIAESDCWNTVLP